ncbi:MAG: tRNA threonylcarbamoyladenosine dehydratase [Deltaproteobacteria bacterium]|nr:tRNA threonylcarbamoyladenosine dehydratase [Deltaproteobacteria bacterium]
MSDVVEISFPPAALTDDAPRASPGFKLDRRFDRMGRLVGESAMERLQRAHVIIFGMGGVGSWTAEGLVRAGVGRLSLVDFDTVCVTNTNRQLHAVKGAFGKLKCDQVAERCRLINPDARVDAVPQFYNADTANALLPAGGEPDHVVDAIDNMKAKLHLLHNCITRRIPVISSMGAAGRMDPTQVRMVELCETHADPFAKDVRKLLRIKYGVDTSVPCGVRVVFSAERRRNPQPLSYDHGGFLCVCPGKANDFHTCDHRTRIDGSAGFVTTTFGMVAAGAVVNRLVGGTA